MEDVFIGMRGDEVGTAFAFGVTGVAVQISVISGHFAGFEGVEGWSTIANVHCECVWSGRVGVVLV